MLYGTGPRREKFRPNRQATPHGILTSMKVVRLWVPICVAGMMLGCGQKGPLLLPDAHKHKRVIPRPPATPATSAAPATSATTGTPNGNAAAPSDPAPRMDDVPPDAPPPP